jgi:hypothetical protein
MDRTEKKKSLDFGRSNVWGKGVAGGSLNHFPTAPVYRLLVLHWAYNAVEDPQTA